MSTRLNVIDSLRVLTTGADHAKPLSKTGSGGAVPPQTEENRCLPHGGDGVLAVRSGFACAAGILPLLLAVFLLTIPAFAAHYLIDDSGFVTMNTFDRSMVQSGWNFDNRGGPLKLTDAAPYELNDVSNAFGTRLVRSINAQTGGKMTLESKFTLSSGCDGFYYEFQSSSGATAYKLFTDNGAFNVNNGGTTAQLGLAAATGAYSVKVILDLETATSQTVINNVSFGFHNFAGPVSDIKQLILGTTAEDVIRVIPSSVTLTADYAAHERFTQVNTGFMPYDWTNTVSDRYGYYLAATATTSDPIIQMKNDVNLAIAGVNFIKIRAKGCVGNTIRVYFTTAADTTWNEAKAIGCSVTNGNMTDYVLPIYSNGGWTGTLKKLRIDPLTSTNSFAIESVKLMIDTANEYQAYYFVDSSGTVSTDWYYWNMSTPSVVRNPSGYITSTATTSDPLIQMKNDVNLAIAGVNYIKIRAKGYVGNTIRVYFTTAADTTWNEAKAMGCGVTNGNMTDYVLPIYTNGSWTGTLKKLRIDPLSSANSFAIESVTLMVDTVNEYQAYYFVNSSGTVATNWNYVNMGTPSVAYSANHATACVDNNEMKLSLSGTGSATVQKTFDALSGTVCFETLFFLPAQANGAEFRLLSGTNTGISVKTLNNKIVAGTSEVRSYYRTNMWYRLRIEADTDTDTAVIKINGKNLGTVPFENAVSSLNSVKALLMGSAGGSLRFDDVLVYPISEPADYVAEPAAPERTTDAIIGINVCSLWRNGEHNGWDNISPFDEVKPVLGYYDDFTPEVADWEIKFMAEHGIDYGSYCWYSSQTNAPIKTTKLAGALVDGYMNAKYSDRVKFSLLWEAANGKHPASSAAFRNYFVPYWVENFFTDDRYMLIENKPVITVFGWNSLITDFGSEANVAAELNYVRGVCQGLGFDGTIFIACNSSAASGTLQSIKNCGFDAIQAYNWGKAGSDPTYTQTVINEQYNAGIIHVVPTLSTGFNNVGWGGERSANMTVSDFSTMLTWFRDTALPRNNTADWRSRLLMLSTWNEYGEGTYIMPSGLNGFGYLDAVRSVFTENPAHADSIPTASQKARLGYMYPQDRAIIRPLKIENAYNYPQDILQAWDFVSNRAVSTAWSYSSMSAPSVVSASGYITATATTIDPIIQMKNDVNLAISGVNYIKIRAKGYVGETIKVFFITAADTVWNEAKSISCSVTNAVMKDYYLPIYTKSGWTGTLKKLRIDPLTSTNSFAIESAALMYDVMNAYQTYYFVNASGAVSADWNYSAMSTPVVEGGAITATATTTDPLIQMKNDANLAIPAVSYIKIRAKGYVGNSIQVYFTTAADTTWNEAKAMSCSVTSGNMTDYYLPMYTKSGWTGTLKKLRIDPLSSTNSFAIESVSLLYTENPITVRVDGIAVPLWCNPVVQGTHTMIPMNPDTGVFYYFDSYFEWDKASGVLRMYANNQSIVFTIGSSTASVNGVPTALGCLPYLNDGIPMVPVDAIVDAFGYNATYGSGTIDITTLFQPLSVGSPTSPRFFLLEVK